MKIVFKYIEIEGFRGIVDFMRFQLDRPGLNLMKGANGAGKTTTFEALVWALFGVNLKDTVQDRIASWPELRGSSFKGTRVSVIFSVNGITYNIVRHLGYKGETYGVKGEDSLMFAKGDDDRAEQLKPVGDFINKEMMQEEINRILGLTPKTFMNSVLFGQRMARLVEQDNGDKRKLFEVLFETGWVDVMKSKNDAKIQELDVKQQSYLSKIQVAQSSIHTQENLIQSGQELLDGFEQNRQIRLKFEEDQMEALHETATSLNDELQTYTEHRDSLKYDRAAHEKIQTDYNELLELIKQADTAANQRASSIAMADQKIALLGAEVVKAQAALDKLKAKHIEGNCPYCNQELLPGNQLQVNHDNDIKEASRAVDIAHDNLNQAKDVRSKLNYATQAEITRKKMDDMKAALLSKLEGFNAVLAEYNQDEAYIYEVNRDIQQNLKDKERVNASISRIKAEQPPKIDLDALRQAIEAENKSIIEYQTGVDECIKALEIARWWNTKGFSAAGIKSFIFKAMLTQLNENVRKYGQRLGAALEFSIDLTKASRPFTTKCSLGDKLNKEYKEFSGGEKQRLDIVLIFAMYDLISMGLDINILLMDEVFEGLDEEGEAAVFDLIRGKANEGKTVYVITHSSTLDGLYSNHITFESIKGKTHLIN